LLEKAFDKRCEIQAEQSMGAAPSSRLGVFEHNNGHVRADCGGRSARLGWGLASGCAGSSQHCVHEGKAACRPATGRALGEESIDVAWRFHTESQNSRGWKGPLWVI